MPSRERLARINLHEVSFGVDKFSAQLDLVDSSSSTRGQYPFLVANRASKPAAKRAEPDSPRELYEFRRSGSLARPSLYPVSPPGPSAPHPMETKKDAFAAVRSLVLKSGVPISTYDFDRA
jgi:hypothetical protein